MSKDSKESAGKLLKKIKEEIIPMLEETVSNGTVSFPNPHLVKCWEILDCKATNCALYGNDSGSTRCWQVEDTYCNGKHQETLKEKYHECKNCKVFNIACPTIVEEIGEYFNNMMYLINTQKQQLLEDNEHRLYLNRELTSALEQLRIKENEIQELMITDKLTTLFNRQHLKTVLEDDVARSQRYGRPLAVMLIDIDEFKSFNNDYGRLAGDSMLAFVGSLIRENTRKFDRAFRYGGEEFVVVLPETDLTLAYIVAERIRRGFEGKSFAVSKQDSEMDEYVSRTVSIGLTATYAFGTEDISVDELINQTEKTLQHAQDKGGNLSMRYE
jgi:diguanylate cyclase (GGDEF)-like protein